MDEQTGTTAEQQAREDIQAAFHEWERDYPLQWDADEMITYYRAAESGTVRDSEEYAEAIARLLPDELAAARKGYEERAAQFFVARIGLPGLREFRYSVHDDVDCAEEELEMYRCEADTVEMREAARCCEAMRGDTCLWETWRSGRLIYTDLLSKL